ncbi:MAG: hypothetical protein PSW75_07495 [bacterium]|nr:hypothetical protein [bacterium]MDI1334819.1 hypothetical protein [Lacunisphaera sp.]
MKKLVKRALVCGLLLVVCSILWVVLLPTIVASTIRSRTGFAVQVEKLSVNPFLANARISGLVLKNPDGWPEAAFVNLRQFQADVDLLPLLGDKFMADEILVDIAQLTLVRNQDGVLNAMAFKDGLTGGHEAGSTPTGNAKAATFLIRHLVLKFDKLVYADYSGRRPVVKDYDLNIQRDLTNVDSVAKIVSPFAGATLGVMSDAVGRLFKVPPSVLEQSVAPLQEAGKKTGETLKSIFQSLEKRKP